MTYFRSVLCMVVLSSMALSFSVSAESQFESCGVRTGKLSENQYCLSPNKWGIRLADELNFYIESNTALKATHGTWQVWCEAMCAERQPNASIDLQELELRHGYAFAEDILQEVCSDPEVPCIGM